VNNRSGFPEPDGVDSWLKEAALAKPDLVELGRVRRRVEARISARGRTVNRTLIIGVPLAAGLAIAAPTWRWARRPVSAPSSPGMTPAPAEEVREPVTPGVETGPVDAQSQVAQKPLTVAKIQRRASRSAATKSSALDTLGDETRRLASAISRLRKGADPRGALKEIDEYRRLYPAAHFDSEARMLRIEALIAVGERPAALDELAAARIPSLPRSEELWVLRGEILLDLKRPREALDAFDAALRIAKTDAFIERALAGRASAQRSLRP
jgi:hypothetical protein